MVMKRIVQLEKLISRGMDRLARRGGAESDPIEWIQPMLDEIASQVVPTGGRGRRFPHAGVTLEVRGGKGHVERTRAAFQSVDLRARLLERLQRERCAPPDALAVRVRYKVIEESAPTDEPVWRLTYPPVAATPLRGASARAIGSDWLELTVIAGTTGRRIYLLDRDVVRIGRLETVEGRRPQDLRRNDVAFSDDGDPVNASVSRAHAHVLRSSAGEFRAFDDGSTHGTRVLRSGREIPVTAGDRVGVVLRHDDELLLGGRARLRVRFRPAPAPRKKS